MKRIVALVLVVAAVAGWWFFLRRDPSAAGKVRYRTAKVDRGQVVEGVAASGTVQPVELIQVGTQVSGVIQELRVDFNSKVTAKQVIALLDARRLQSQVDQDLAAVARAKADLKRLEAGVEQAKADVARVQSSVVQAASDVNRVKEQLVQARTDVDRADALLLQAKTELERQRQLVEKRLTSQSDLDAATANAGSLAAQRASALAAVRQTEAQVATAEAAVKQAEAQVAVSEAALRQSESQLPVGEAAITLAEAQLAGDRVNLEYATIVSPVDGVVVSRNVDVGQTVAASLSAPTLFVIAKDLTKVQVQTSVPEADIGRVRAKQPVSFTVDAYPERTFPGEVTQVRYASTTVSNVVTYTVIVDASNPDTLLFPGMTANVTFEVARSKEGLRVPATALRLQPAAELLEAPPAATPPTPDVPDAAMGAGSEGAMTPEGAMAPEGAGAPAGTGAPGGTGGGNGRGRGGRGGGTRGSSRGTVYVTAPGNRLRAVPVRTGVSDGAMTVIEPVEAGALVEGTEVVTAIVKEVEAATTSPLMPSGPRMGGRPSGGR